MSQVQDVFGGAAPKSVLNKPLMEMYCSAIISFPLGMQTITLDNIVINEISGASLDPSTGKVTLPPGVYDFDGQIPFRSGAVAGQYTSVMACIINDAEDQIGIGTRTSARNDRNANVAPIVTRLTFAATTTVRLALLVGSNDGQGESNLTGADIQKFGTLRISKLDSNVETPVISDPTMVLARPLMHVQDQKPSGTGTPDSVAGWQDRELNTTLTNDIAGASLGVNAVILPAGTYDIVGRAPVNSVNNRDGRGRLAVTDDVDSILILGQSEDLKVLSTNDITGVFIEASGRITLAATTTIKLRHYTVGAHSNVLGRACSTGENEVYADLQIRQLDSLIRQPVLVNDKLYPLPGNVIVTGNMHGLEYEYNTVDTFTVQAGICMDSLNETVLTLQNPQLVDLNNATQNPQGLTPDTVYNIFLTDDGQLVKVDTDVNGANLPVNDKRRWIGSLWVELTSSIRPFIFVDGLFQFDTSLLIADPLETTATRYTTDGYAHPSRVKAVTWMGEISRSDGDGNAYLSQDAQGAASGNLVRVVDNDGNRGSAQAMFAGNKVWAYRSSSGTVTFSRLYIASIELKR